MKIVTYLRVSTNKQRKSGLGIDAQREAVQAFARANCAEINAEYLEYESGTRSDRPQLQKAIAHARLAKATLVVAKLDRLARNVAFTAALMESKVDFVACDNPTANSFTIHILAACAEHEAKAASERTKAALVAAKARGVKLGSHREGHWEGREERRLAGCQLGSLQSAKSRKQAAAQAYSFLLEKMRQARSAGTSFSKIAAELNALGHQTRAGAPWNAVSVRRVMVRAAA